jgi:hypothetical protein
MLPISSNTADQGCSPVSSNCVVWQGPNLPCINLCKGDTVSDVVYKVATDLCTIKDQLDLSDLDLSSLVSFCASSNPAPTNKTLAAVLDFIIAKVSCLDDRTATLEGGSSGSAYSEPTLTLPTCLQYTNAQGQNVTQLIHNQYTLTLANKICSVAATVSTHTTQISGLNTRVATLENATGVTLPKVSLQCLTGNTTLLNLDEALSSVATDLCSLRTVVGTNTAITSAAAKQCTNLNSLPALSSAGTMSGLAGWKSTVTTLSDSINNLWLTICDLRAGLVNLNASVSVVNCGALVIDFTATLNVARTSLTINFNGLTSYQGVLGLTGFSDCSQAGSILTIEDTAGKKFITNVNIVSNATNASGVTIAIPTGTGSNELNASLNYKVTLSACVKKDNSECNRSVEKTLYAPCTTITINSATIS